MGGKSSSARTYGDAEIEELRGKLEGSKNGHLFSFFDELDSAQKGKFVKDILDAKIDDLDGIFEACVRNPPAAASLDKSAPTLLTFDSTDKLEEALPSGGCGVCRLSSTSAEVQKLWSDKGFEMIRQGQLAALCMAGGQGTRLGLDKPKGMFPIGPISQKSLFQIFCERILRLQTLATEGGKKKCVPIPFCVMTSDLNHTDTEKYFKDNKFFGLSKSQVHIFQQPTIPAFTMEGGLFLEEKGKLARAPNGNGGIFQGLLESGLIEALEKKGVTGLHVFSVDNVLGKVADPLFCGFCETLGVEVGNKCVEKTNPEEKVGVMCVKTEKEKEGKGKACVVEYSELSEEEKTAKGADGHLAFSAGNIANHYFTLQFAKRIATTKVMDGLYHKAEKKIPHIDPKSGELVKPSFPNGVKLEMFIFDAFEFADKVAGLEVPRDEEFAPVKNATGVDSPESAAAMVASLHQSWLKTAGAVFEGDAAASAEEGKRLEISALKSYGGEGLEEFSGKELRLPLHVS
uniref:UDP-N-acetylglucosamine diphosphorylase n=1 Tax=Chromera velia CCMP2878 TaxID=1169474 RepID=A0A0G4GFG9_9ALVE|mmetsp:Transcript_7773/g.15132  ORF Transcript_7773/g.15132 Transcript_7773/m.15132 type:complete len:515 (-) Transcript_7773:435-1979(-)|eukprot:Cvel_21578.t1-p1 / transcript=Cvel_21578.t1 / gene=Cvel_21578 / organism=Chromera_velia_CCMP2878 / gene_product=UDP-N-acetylhexosamine pyrophosphorylase-like, putative / transcript_product=UDP-N-acetylhexosamine pyrophosphorylase-like, putative / location=Cvel_scaffold2036:13570-17519(-) / protein_length=514 / sequence_SO=supercontig / SO=protein_coding / is_pseudo=false